LVHCVLCSTFDEGNRSDFDADEILARDKIAYAEIFVTETLWPDFTRARLLEALIEFQKRERRYGGIGEDEPSSEKRARVIGT